jgi:hypothetical protein
LFLIFAAFGEVRAAEVEVRVMVQGQDRPVEGAAVCLGSRGDARQFGAYFGGVDGVVKFRDVPYTPLVLTVSRDGFRGERQVLPPARFNRVVTVSLPFGGGGPVCHAERRFEEPKAAPRGLEITRFVINGGAATTDKRQVTLDLSVRGSPTHYRASERPGFKGAQWKPFETSPLFELSPGVGTKVVYVQVRSRAGVAGGSLEKRSDVRAESIELVAQ